MTVSIKERRPRSLTRDELNLINTARQENGYWLFQVHNGRMVKVRRVTRPIEPEEPNED